MAEKRYTFVFLVAIIIALAATAGVFRALRAIREGSHVAMAQVIVANRDIPEGQLLDRRDLQTTVWPAASVPAGAFSSGDSLVGRVTRVSVFTGEPIVPGRLAPVGTGAGIEVKITPGKRAMAIRIDEVAGMAGLIQPNSRVDILVSMRDENAQSAQGGKRVAKLFMENMRVLSVGTQVYRGDDGKPIRAASATLEVSPEEAERLAIAVGTGSIQLVLRGYGDPDSIKTRGATSSDVLSQMRSSPTVVVPLPDPPAPVRHHAAAAPRPTPAAPTPPPVVVARKPKSPDSVTVQVFRAGKVSQQHFQRDSSAPDSASQ
jgi:pilus assembly protein CpaB